VKDLGIGIHMRFRAVLMTEKIHHNTRSIDIPLSNLQADAQKALHPTDIHSLLTGVCGDMNATGDMNSSMFRFSEGEQSFVLGLGFG
jgi:hypothetical protein